MFYATIGLLLLQIDRRLGFLKAVDGVIPDPRGPRYIEHSQLSVLRQRVYGICLGYEDLNDHQTLRIDPALQSSIEREEVLGSQSTLCRLENRMDRQVAVNIHKLLLEPFIASYDEPPEELVLNKARSRIYTIRLIAPGAIWSAKPALGGRIASRSNS